MRKINCRELGGACDMEFFGNSFEDVVKQSQEHGMQMFQKKDKLHLNAMEEMKSLMASSDAMEKWMIERQTYFDSLPDEVKE